MDTLHEENLFSSSQVAEILGVNRITVFRWIKDGVIKAQKVGRNYAIPHEELLKLLDKKVMNDAEKAEIKKLVDRAINDYGETIRMLGRE